jgi:hypothetical protein
MFLFGEMVSGAETTVSAWLSTCVIVGLITKLVRTAIMAEILKTSFNISSPTFWPQEDAKIFWGEKKKLSLARK